MDNKDYLVWVDFYSEFATKLLEYLNNRKVLIGKLQDVFDTIEMKLPKLERDENIEDIDPFTVFGLFNKGITKANRIAIITGISKIFSIESKIPETFDGIPVLNNQRATFYYFIGDRAEKDIDNLWGVFKSALEFADNPTDINKADLVRYYDAVLQQKGVRWNITMGLYWVRPYIFVNLDSRNREFICDPQNIANTFISEMDNFKQLPAGEQYIQLCESSRTILKEGDYPYKNFPELSYYAWTATEKNKEDKKTVSNAAFLKWFRPLITALRELGGSTTPKEAREQIIKDEELSDDVVNETRGKTKVNKFENEVAFARNYLVYGGYIDKSIHGVWTLTEKGKTVEMTEKLAAELFVKGMAANQSKRESTGEAVADKDVDTVHYWLYAPGDGASKWDEFYNDGIIAIGWGEIGNLEEFVTKDEMKQKMKECYGSEYSYKNAAHATWQFVHEMKPGDIVFAKKGKSFVIGRGVVTSDYEYDVDQADAYNNVRKINWTHNGEWPHPGQAVMKTLTDITAYTDYVEKLSALFEEDMDEDVEEEEVSYPSYNEDDFLNEVYMSYEKYEIITNLLQNKKNIILQGAPGVGKTYAAKRLAYSIMGVKDKERVMMVQFHQSYSYEDFIMGFRPSVTGFELKKGPFYNFCKKAEVDSDNEYFFIIDEINRGNLSKIFGELFMLIENDKRGVELQLLYSDEKFSVPDNVYIIGMMNTADRSLAMLDYALRRRFAFFEFEPAFDTDGFKKYQEEINNTNFNNLIAQVQQLNIAIENDESLGKGFRIGHSYFCTATDVNDAWLSGVIDFELVPLLNEYWFDEPEKVRDWTQALKGTIK